jgi:hypothetical protein
MHDGQGLGDAMDRQLQRELPLCFLEKGTARKLKIEIKYVPRVLCCAVLYCPVKK